MPPRRRLFGLPSSKTAYQELRRVGRYAGKVLTSKPAVGALLAAPFKSKSIRKAVTTRKSMPRMSSKMGYRASKTVASSNTQLEGQTVKLNKVIHINIGGTRQIKSLPPALDPLWHKYIFQMYQADRATLSEAQGRMTLDCVQDYLLPLHVWELTHLDPLLYSNASFHGGRYTQAGHWEQFSDNASRLQIKDAETGIGNADTVNRCTTWLFHQARIRLLLYGRTKQSTHYQIIFFRVKDEEASPLLDSTQASAGNLGSVQRTIWSRRLGKFTVNPVHLAFDHVKFRGQANTDIQILKTFNYHIKEQLGTEDSVSKVNVNITAHINKIKSHVYNNALTAGMDGDITAAVPAVGLNPAAFTNAHKSPQHSQRLYMAIMGTCYEIQGETNYEAPSYDIGMQVHASASVIHGWPN